AIIALITLTVAARPASEKYTFGYTKAEYFSSGMEGALILLAAGSIGWTATVRLLAPQPIEKAGFGLLISVLASAVNFGVARVLLKAGKQHNSITLEADAHHLMTDVWTSAGVIVGVGAVALTGWQRLDPIIALLVALNIIWTGVQLLRRSAAGLMDIALPAVQQQAIQQVLDRYIETGIQFHALRTRQAGARHFLSVHVLVPAQWTVKEGHDLVECLEAELRQLLPQLHIITHLEPQGDAASYDDLE